MWGGGREGGQSCFGRDRRSVVLTVLFLPSLVLFLRPRVWVMVSSWPAKCSSDLINKHELRSPTIRGPNCVNKAELDNWSGPQEEAKKRPPFFLTTIEWTTWQQRQKVIYVSVPENYQLSKYSVFSTSIFFSLYSYWIWMTLSQNIFSKIKQF